MTAEANTSLRWRFLTLSADQLIFKWSQAQVLFFLSEEIRVGSSLWRKLDYFRKTFLKRSHEELRFWTWLNLYIKWNPYPPTPISCAKKKKKQKKNQYHLSFLCFSSSFFPFHFCLISASRTPGNQCGPPAAFALVEKATKTESFMKTGIWTIQFGCWGQPHSLLEHSRSNLHWKFEKFKPEMIKSSPETSVLLKDF